MSITDLTLENMRNELHHQAIFIGIGNPEPKIIPIFKGLTEAQGFFTSKSFLPKVIRSSKYGTVSSNSSSYTNRKNYETVL